MLWVLGCLQPRLIKQDGGLPHLGWMVSGDETSYQNASSSGTRDIWQVRREQTVALAKGLQCCAEWSGAPGIMCGTVWDLQRCLVPLVPLDEEDIWEAFLLMSVGDEPVASLTPALLLSEDLEPQEAQASALCLPVQPEEALKPDDAVRYGGHYSRPHGYSVTDTITAIGIWTAHPDVWPTSLKWCTAPIPPSQRSPAGYNLSVNRWVQRLLPNVGSFQWCLCS